MLNIILYELHAYQFFFFFDFPSGSKPPLKRGKVGQSLSHEKDTKGGIAVPLRLSVVFIQVCCMRRNRASMPTQCGPTLLSYAL